MAKKLSLTKMIFKGLLKKYITEQEAKSFEEAYSFLLRVRNELHFRSTRPADVLHFGKQPEIALGLGYKQENIFRRVEAFMGDYYTKAQTIHQISGILEERLVHSNIEILQS